MKLVYLKVLRDALCESVKIEWLVDYVILEYSVDALNIEWKVISRSKETKMKRKREAFVEAFEKV